MDAPDTFYPDPAAYVFTRLQTALAVENIISLHYYEYAMHYRGVVESHDFWEMVYADSGSLICMAGENEIHLTQGQAVLHPPNEVHQLLAIGKDSSACIFSFSCPQLPTEMFRNNTIDLNQNQKNLVGMLYQEGRKIFEGPYNRLYQPKLERRIVVPFGSEQVFRNTLETLLLLMVRDQMAPPASMPEAPNHGRVRNDRAIVESVIDYLNANLYRKLHMSDISTALSFSEGYLQDVFQNQKKQSIMEYFNGMKIYQAKRFIGEGSYNFTQIAESLGFSSVHYFSRVFRRYVKMSPTEYEKSVKLTGLL